METLKPCPFCGGEAELRVGYHAKYDVKIGCNHCDAEGALFGSDDFKGEHGSTPYEAAAIAAWNRRTHGPALLAALRLREGCEGVVARMTTTIADLSIEGSHVDDCVGQAMQSIRDDLARVLEEGE